LRADDSSILVLALIGGFIGLVAGRWPAVAVHRKTTTTSPRE
jgi:hypothetical protein